MEYFDWAAPAHESYALGSVSKNYMTPHLETAVLIACDLCVTQQKGRTKVKKKTPNYFIYEIKCHMYNKLSIKKIYIYSTLNLYIHPAETHRLLKFSFHIMGRLVPAHNNGTFPCVNVVVKCLC